MGGRNNQENSRPTSKTWQNGEQWTKGSQNKNPYCKFHKKYVHMLLHLDTAFVQRNFVK